MADREPSKTNRKLPEKSSPPAKRLAAPIKTIKDSEDPGFSEISGPELLRQIESKTSGKSASKRPSRIVAELDKTIIGSTRVKMVVANAMYQHSKLVGRQLKPETIEQVLGKCFDCTSANKQLLKEFVDRCVGVLAGYNIYGKGKSELGSVVGLLLTYGSRIGILKAKAGAAEISAGKSFGESYRSNFLKYLRATQNGPATTQSKKQNVLIIGGTGTGKTQVLRGAAKISEVPFLKFDSAQLTEAGYVGDNVEKIPKELMKLAGENKVIASMGIVFFDEIDKKASAADQSQRDVSGKGAQQALLAIMEDHVHPETGVDFSTVQFFFGGAFADGLAGIIRKRLDDEKVGFRTGSSAPQLSDTEILQFVTHDDLVAYGLMPELVGRIHRIVVTDPFTETLARKILDESEESPIKQKQAQLADEGVKIQFTDDAKDEIVKLAIRRSTGARALQSIVAQVTEDLEFHAPDMSVKEKNKIISIDRNFVREALGLGLTN